MSLKVKGVADSLAGRAETMEMLPLSQGEVTRKQNAEDFIAWVRSGASHPGGNLLDSAVVLTGGFPVVQGRSARRARAWFTSYTERLADHDARELASQIAELVKSRFARALGIAESTLDAYLRIAGAMRLVAQIPAWHRTPRGRFARRPKICLVDTGLSGVLAHVTESTLTSSGGREYYSALVEQFVALELMKQRAWSAVDYDLYHYRELDGLEVDLVVETGNGDVIAIEVKSGRTVTAQSWENLRRFRSRFGDRNVTGVLLHGGDTSAHLHGWLHILPITSLWEH